MISSPSLYLFFFNFHRFSLLCQTRFVHVRAGEERKQRGRESLIFIGRKRLSFLSEPPPPPPPPPRRDRLTANLRRKRLTRHGWESTKDKRKEEEGRNARSSVEYVGSEKSQKSLSSIVRSRRFVIRRRRRRRRSKNREVA